MDQIQLNGQRNIADRAENQAIRETNLQWSSIGDGRRDVVIHGESDYALLRNLRNILLGLQTEFTEGGNHVVFTGHQRDNFNKRLILLEHEIQGLLKRKINYFARDSVGGTRVMDYSGLLNEKETQIVELEKKINNLEERLRKSNQKELQLQNHIIRLHAQLKRKENNIWAKCDIIMNEVATCDALRIALDRINTNVNAHKRQIRDLERFVMEGVVIPNVGNFNIRADALTRQGAQSRSNVFQNMPQNQRSKAQLVQLFKQFEIYNNQDGISDDVIESLLEGFLIGFNGSKIVNLQTARNQLQRFQDNYTRLKSKFEDAIRIFQTMIQRLKRQNPNIQINYDQKVLDIIRDHNTAICYKPDDKIVQIERLSVKTVEVPVQDARTKHLIHLLAVQMRKFCVQYPKLKDEMDKNLIEFFQQQLIDVIQVDQLDRLISIVKFVPQVVKVENVYAYNSEKSRRIEFHLRVLVKALLEQLQKLKRKTGAVLEIDEGVIGMIKQQIMEFVNVDDILKVFRVVPKIVEVQKIVEKIVDRIVEVPQIVPVQRIIEKIVQVEKIKQVERIVNVPLEVPKIVENIVEKVVPVESTFQKIVQVPHVVERIVQSIKQVPKIQIVEKIVEKQVPVDRVIEVKEVVNHIVTKFEPVQIIIEKVIATEKVIEIIKQIPVIVQKIVDRVVQIPKVIEVQKKVEKIVIQKEVVIAQQIDNHIQVVYEIVDRIVQKPIYITQTVERIVQVPQIVEKIVQVQKVVQQIIQVQKTVQKIVIQQKIIQVIKVVEVPVEIVREVQKEIEKIVEIPIIHECIKQVQTIVEKPVIQIIENTIIKQVYLRDPIIIKQVKIVQVEKIVNHYIKEPIPIKYTEQKIVEVTKHVDRVKQVKVFVEKIIEKMVQVPKVVEVQKIVEKVVVVPRVIQKIVEIPYIIEIVVQRTILSETIKEVEKIVQVPMIKDIPFPVQVISNRYIQVEKEKKIQVDKLVEVKKYEEKSIINDIFIEKITEVIIQVPRNIQVEKIVHHTIEKPKVVEIDKQIIVPVQVPVPMEKIVEKIVPITHIVEKVVQVPSIIEKIIPVAYQIVKIKQITLIQEKIVEQKEYKEIVNQVPYITEKIIEVQRFIDKIAPPVNIIIQKIVTAQQIIQKVVQKTITIPKVYEVEVIHEKIIEIPKIVEVDKIIPYIINVNKFIELIVQKIVLVPIYHHKFESIQKEREKIVSVINQIQKIKQVQKLREKTVVVEKLKQVVRNINHIEKVLQIVDRYEQTQVQVLLQEEKLINIPCIIEKIVEKIVVMPQVVQVLKYVHEITEKEELGFTPGFDIATHEQRLKILSKDIKANFDLLLAELKSLIRSNPAFKSKIELIEKFLAQLKQFILYPKIFQIPKEVVVQKIVEKIVQVPTQDERSIKMELTLSILVEKLIIQLNRLRRENPNLNLQLEEDVKLIFFLEFGHGSNAVSGDFNGKLKNYADSVYRKFQSLGNWSLDHQMMLNSFLQERFLMANLVKNANLEIEKSKAISSRRDQSVNILQTDLGVLQGFISRIRHSLFRGEITREQQSFLNNIFRDFDEYISRRVIEPVRRLDDLQINDARIQSLMREKDAEILRLRDRIFEIQKTRPFEHSLEVLNKTIEALREENVRLKNRISQLQTEHGSAELVASLQSQNLDLEKRNLHLEQVNSNLTTDLYNLRREYEAKLKFSTITGVGESNSPNMSSPVQNYNMPSPNSGTRFVDSQIRSATGGDQASRLGADSSRSYGLDNSGHSGTGTTRQPTTFDQSRTGSGAHQSGTGPTYQRETNRSQNQQATYYQYGTGSTYSRVGATGAGLQGTRTQGTRYGALTPQRDAPGQQ